MLEQLPYCGSAPNPGELLARFNLDPILIITLALIAGAHVASVRTAADKVRAAAGWFVAAAALISPLCALSVSLFSARIAQHMILLLIAAPLVASDLPAATRAGRGLWPLTIAFALALWAWHMPAPYDATLRSTPVY